MGKIAYSKELCEELARRAADPELLVRPRRSRYEGGEVLDVGITGVHPAVQGRAGLRLEKFLGGGFAGQVYRCVVERLDLPEGADIPGLRVGGRYAVKIMIPPGRFSRRFRDLIYWLGFQGPFSAEVNGAACRAGLLWQKVMRRAARIRFGTEAAVKDAYASFWEPGLGAFGEITEWVEGRLWRLEADPELWRRRRWRTLEPDGTRSAEYVAKRRFMRDLVALMHDLGAHEFARQYEWSTMKSQPNAIKRTDAGDEGPAAGLCAIDFRAGLALLPFLPMSPADLRLIVTGLVRRGALVQFDRGDLARLDGFVAKHAADFTDLQPLLEELRAQDTAYRRSLPDVTHHGLRPLWDRALRRDIRRGLIQGYAARGLAEPDFARGLEGNAARFAGFYLLGAVPLAGRSLRRLWGNATYRRHVAHSLTSLRYFRRHLASAMAHRLAEWHRSGRAAERHARFLLRHPAAFYLERWTLGLLPVGGLHRAIVEPAVLWRGLVDFARFLKRFFTSAEFREQWFLGIIEEGEREGMLTAQEAAEIRVHVHDPFIMKYLKCVGAHFATLPLTQIVSVTLGAVLAGVLLARGRSWAEATAVFASIVVLFQVIPISPGSLARGLITTYMVVRDRSLKDYLVALPLSFWKYIGYLAFPLQMTATYPQLARFMAGRWATQAVHIVPVFGEKGALLEHWVFDLFFNVPQMVGLWCKPRIRGLLNGWMGAGLALTVWAFRHWDLSLKTAMGFNLAAIAICVFVLPRILFYPLLRKGGWRGGAPRSKRILR